MQESPNPSGLCLCGCGKPTTIAKRNERQYGLIKGQPKRFIHGHSNRSNIWQSDDPRERSGICACGCGKPTAIPNYTNIEDGIFNGIPNRFLRGHAGRIQTDDNPNPSGLCQCGCGQKTSIAKNTIRFYGWVSGKPKRFIRGHHPKPFGEGPNPTGLCLCGCGEITLIAKVTINGMVRGTPRRYIPGHHRRRERSPSWKEGRYTDPEGYVYCYIPNHPAANATGYVFEHRLVMEKMLGRYLEPQERVHHKNGVRDDNREDNLTLLPNSSAHARLHAQTRRAIL